LPVSWYRGTLSRERGQHYRIGFPYAKPSEAYKEAWVDLSPSHVVGFREVYFENERFALAPEDIGPKILDRLDSRGCTGRLWQWGEGREIIDRRSGRLTAQGRSMQLALVLATFAEDATRTNAPLLLCSAAIDHPFGHPPFQGARIIPYADADHVRQDLLGKFLCAQRAGAIALALPHRDALLLQEALLQQGQDLPLLKLDQWRKPPQELSLLALMEGDLPQLASLLGCASQNFTLAARKAWPWGRLLAGGLLLGLMATLWLVHQSHEKTKAFLRHRRELLTNIYAPSGASIHRRLRDDCLKEFLILERQQNGQQALQNSGRSYEQTSERIDLKEVVLQQADLHLCDLSNINFLNAQLQQSNLNRTNLQGSYCKLAQFQNSHLYKANLRYTVLSYANFEGANLHGTDFSHAVGLELALLKGSRYDAGTLWPEGWNSEMLFKMGAVLDETKTTPVFVRPEQSSSR
jgi:hypothetical protein